MIICITGLTGSGKTWLQTQMIRRSWREGFPAHVNYPVSFPPDNEDVYRWHQLPEIYDIKNGVIGIDEGQKLFDARKWFSLPQSFTDKITQHRKHGVDIITNTQDLGQIDIRIRSNIHELYNCKSVIRIPRNERVKPVFQILSVMKYGRTLSSETQRITWHNIWKFRRLHFISKYWTVSYYNTYADVGLEKYLCRIKLEKNKWQIKLYNRDLVDRGRARL